MQTSCAKSSNSCTKRFKWGLTGLDVFVKMVSETKLKARVGETEMEFDRRHIECLKDLASQIPTGTFFEGRLHIKQDGNKK